jgi:hypothetical protein
MAGAKAPKKAHPATQKRGADAHVPSRIKRKPSRKICPNLPQELVSLKFHCAVADAREAFNACSSTNDQLHIDLRWISLSDVRS